MANVRGITDMQDFTFRDTLKDKSHFFDHCNKSRTKVANAVIKFDIIR